MTNFHRFLLLSVALGSSLVTRADETPARPAIRSLSSVFTVLDIDQNGALSASEIAAAPVALAALDADDDGKISPSEWRNSGAKARAGRSVATSNLVFALDANHDGELTRTELRPVIVARN